MITVNNNKVIYVFKSKMEAVQNVKLGEVFKVMTNDCFYQQITNEEQVLEEIDYDLINPATGPIFIEGAEKGDLLKVKVLDIEVSDKGISMAVPGEGVLGSEEFNSIVKVIPIEDGNAKLFGLHIPVVPMIGVIGLAPAEKDGDWGTASPWKHGGNMDTSEIKKGSILYLPVNQTGALLALGDLHAAMGDGELCFTGLEIPGVVTLEVDVIKDTHIEWPLLETEKETMVIASGDNIEQAISNGTKEVVHYLMWNLKLKFEEAYLLSSLVSNVKVSQVVDPKKTIRISIPKNILSTEMLIRNLR